MVLEVPIRPFVVVPLGVRRRSAAFKLIDMAVPISVIWLITCAAKKSLAILVRCTLFLAFLECVKCLMCYHDPISKIGTSTIPNMPEFLCRGFAVVIARFMQVTVVAIRVREVKGVAVCISIAKICTLLGIRYRNSIFVVILFPARTAWIAGVSNGGIELGPLRGFSLNSLD